jgi:hypothetical protein
VEEFVTLIVNNWVPKDDEYAKNLKVGWGGVGGCTKLNAVLFRVCFFQREEDAFFFSFSFFLAPYIGLSYTTISTAPDSN